MGIYREDPKERLRLIEVELLENIRPERKVTPYFRSMEGVSRQHTYSLFSFKNTIFVVLILCPCFLSRNGGL